MSSQAFKNKRKHIRYRPEPMTHAQLDLRVNRAEFVPQMIALIVSESFGGCGLVTLATDKMQAGDRCQIKIGELHPMPAEVIWRKPIDVDVVKLGMRFIS